MAKKYIDAELLKDNLRAACLPVDEKGISGMLGDEKSIADYIDDEPPVDVAEVKHAIWNGWTKPVYIGREDKYGNPRYVDHAYYRCSKCDYGSVVKSHFCPNCGARMDGENNG